MDRTPRNLPPLNLSRASGGGGGLGTGRSLPPTGRSLPRTIPESRCSSASSSVDTKSIASRSTAQVSGEFYRVPNSSRSRAMTSRSNPGTSRFPPLKSNPSVNRPPSQNSFFELKNRFANLFPSPRSSDGQFIQRSSSEECLKCMLKVPHQRCESSEILVAKALSLQHKYIRVGGGYRHSFWYVKALLEEIELRRQQEIIRQQRLEAIHEKQVRAVKTYIRTKSGKLVERIVFLSEEDYQNFKAGGKDAAAAILKKYLNKEEAKGLAKWDKEEQKVITTYIRTKSGRRIAKTVYVNKSDYEAMKRGDVDATALLRKYVKPENGETVEGWGEAEMKTLKTFVRTKSGRLIEKTILVTKDDYEKLEAIRAAGGDPNELLSKYMSMDEGATVESWAKNESKPMNVIKTVVRTKSGRLIEKTVLLTAEEYAEFQASGGDVNLLKKYMDIGKDDVIEDWERASTVYSASGDEAIEKAEAGTRVVGKDGTLYEIVVDEVTGKRYKRKVKDDNKNKKGKGKGANEDPNEKGMTKKQKEAYRAGNRRDGSDSEYSYKSHVSAGGTRHVQRRRRRGDGTYSAAESYHSDKDVEGKKRRQARRNKRKEVAIKEKKKALAAGGRNENSDSDYSYKSVVSAGGTRHVTRRKKLAGGGRGKEEVYDEDKDIEGKQRRQARRKQREEKIKKGGRDANSAGSAYSYRSVISAGGTRHVTRMKRLPGGKRGKPEEYHSDQDEEGKKRRQARRKQREEKIKKGGRDANSAGSAYSYRSVISAGGTRHVTRRKKLADGKRGEAEVYHSDQDEEGKKRRQARRKQREEKIKKGGRNANSAGSAYSYRSVVSAGGTRRVTRRKRLADGTRGEVEEYHSDQDEEGKKRRQARRKQREEKIKKGGRDANSAGSAYSYRSVVSAGGTRRVKRRLKNADGTRGAEEDYNSADDEEGKKRRQARRNQREKQHKEKLAKGGRDAASDGSAYSYRSVVSAGGTRHVKRRKRNADGTRGQEEDYNSADDEEGKKRRQKRRQERKEKVAKGGRNPGSDSDYSYRSVRSAGGTRHVKRRKKLGDGKYGEEEDYNSDDDPAGKERRMKRRQERRKAEKQGKRNANSDSDYSYRSVHSAGGTRHVRRRKKNADGTYGDDESYHSSQDEAGQERRRRRRRERKHAGSAHSYYSEVSVGGTRKVMRRRRRGDGTYSAAQSYHSSDSDNGKGKRKKKRPPRVHGADSDHSYRSEVSAGGTRRRKRVQRIRDKDGNVIGYGKEEAYTSDSSMEFVDDGKGGKVKVRKKKPVFEGSLASTDSENEPDLSKMTKAEREKYLKDKAARKEERERRRKEKFGDQYEEMMQKHKSQKAAEKAAKSQVHYQKGSDRFKDKTEYDDRQPGLGHSEWGSKLKGKGKKSRGGDGHDADDEGDDLDADGVQRRRKKGGRGGGDSDEESVYEYARDEKGNIIRDKDGKPIMKKVGTMKKKGNRQHREGVIDSDSEYEYMKDRHGNVVRKKKGVDEESDGDYFDVAPDGTVRLRKGKRKIDLSKLSHADLKKLGIDPETMTKEQIARILKAKFGEDITITKAGKRVGLKAADEMKGANTDDLADDSDLDTSTLKGQRRVRVLMRKGGQQILEHMKNVISNSDLVDEAHTHPEERDASIDFLNHYRLVDGNKVDMYARAFVVEDEDFDSVVNIREAKQALGGVPTIQSISKKQMDYIQKLLDLDKETHVTFRMFSVMTALAERVTAMDQYCKHLLEVSDLMDIQRKMELFKSMFYCNVRGDRDPNYIKADSLRIELIAGGLNWQQQDYVMEKMAPNEWREISFFDYLCYVPLFMSMHDKMVENPLDMSNTKYVPSPSRQPSPVQRDYNPLGYPLKRNSMFISNHAKSKDLTMKTDDLLPSKLSQDSLDLYKKYSKLPSIKSTKSEPTFTGRGKTKL